MSEPETVTPPSTKPGWKTSEFYFGWAAKLIGGFMAAGVFGTGTVAERIAGAILVLLAQWGYTYSRTIVKTAAALLLALGLGGPQVACSGTAGQRVKNGATAAIQCEMPQIVAFGLQAKPALEAAALGVLSGDGLHVDAAKLKAIAAPMVEPSLRCALNGVIAALLHPESRKSGTAMSASLRAPPELGPEWERVKTDLNWPELRE